MENAFTMSIITSLNLRVPRAVNQFTSFKSFSIFRNAANRNVEEKNTGGEDDFRVLNISGNKSFQRPKRTMGRKLPVLPPRSNKMPVDQNWPSVWPVAKTFHPASVPIPLHQGWVEVGSAPPGKFANVELMKIPNFLHLTPPAVQQHCEALKKFCTEWPENLETEESIDRHFPLQITSSDYCHSSPTLRDSRARIVTVQVKLSCLHLDNHAQDKLKRLVKERYDPSTDILTIVADRCPLKKQNVDYATYLLNVLVSEARKTEPWESERVEADMERYVWEGSRSQHSLKELSDKMSSVDACPETVTKYAEAVTHLHNKGEDAAMVNSYKEATLSLLKKNRV